MKDVTVATKLSIKDTERFREIVQIHYRTTVSEYIRRLVVDFLNQHTELNLKGDANDK
ncbi:hypothetical protein [Cetobacterium somerae]|nr:hypothetical protein [Cetobacterium somerae]